jgi:small subunit ribosomal protein S2
VRELGQATGLPFVSERWIGGLLTNFETVQKRIQHLKDLEALQASEDFKKYTKWEQNEMEKERKRLEQKFGGVKNLERLPDAICIFDLDENKLAVREARHKGISIFAIVDTNGDPTKVDYMIPANDDAVSSINYIVNEIREAIINAKTKIPSV